MDLIGINPQGDNTHCIGWGSSAWEPFRSRYGITRDHHGFASQRIYNIHQAESYEAFFQQVDQVSPKSFVMRPIWNIYSFDAQGQMYQGALDELKALAASGRQYLAMMADGPSQRYRWPEFDDEKKLADLNRRQLTAWGLYMDMLDANPDVAAAVYGYEPVNEPDGYRRYESLLEEYRVQRYLEHMCNVFDLVQARHPRDVWHIAGWRFSNGHHEVLQMPLPDYGVSGEEYLRSRMGPDVEIRCSLHGQNDGFRATQYDRLSYNSPNSWRRAAHYDEVHCVNNESAGRSSFVENIYDVDVANVRNIVENDISYALGLSYWWWPLNDTSPSRIFDVGGNGARIKALYRGSLAQKFIKQSYPQQPEFFFGPQNGIKDETSPDSRIIEYDNFEPGGSETFPDAPPEPVNIRHSVIFGGAGHCRLNATDDQTNLLIGGDGRNYLYGGERSWDVFKLGRGGGVVRTGGGHNAVFGGLRPSRIYMRGWGKAAFQSAKSAFPDIAAEAGRQELILDPTGTYVVWFFEMSRDWQISFMGAFQTADELRAAIQKVPTYYPGQAGDDLMIEFPQGGSVRFRYTDTLATQLHRRCLDLTEGWYAEGWTEPPDYDPADLDLPPVIEDWESRYTFGGNQQSAVLHADGSYQEMRDGYGNRMTVDPTFIKADRWQTLSPS